MGDKGGKKDKNKTQKQKVTKQEQQDSEEAGEATEEPSVRGVRIRAAKTPISDKVQYVYAELQNLSRSTMPCRRRRMARLHGMVLCDQLTYTSALLRPSRTSGNPCAGRLAQ